MVEHGGDAVEPEAVEPEDVDPHPQVGQQEPEDLPLEVVEEARVPEGVGAARPGMEETRVYKEVSLVTKNKFNRKTRICNSCQCKAEHPESNDFKSGTCRAVVVAQLVVWPLLIPEIRSSNPNIGNILSTNGKDENKLKETGKGPA